MKYDLENLKKNKIIYDYSPTFKREFIDKIKAKFSEQCQNDNTLSATFQK